MPVICLGPVCVPLHLLLPFLVTLAHQKGYLKWFKKEWVTLAFWMAVFNRLLGRGAAEKQVTAPAERPAAGAATEGSEPAAATAAADGGNSSRRENRPQRDAKKIS